jgi:uncharacterized protein YecT (DUF1311 family)
MSVRVISIGLLIVGFAVSSRVLADPTLECPGGSQIEIGSCLAETEQRVEQSLGSAIEIARRMATDLDEATGRSVAVEALDKGQAAWSAFRDAHCDYVGATFGGGSGTGQAIRACRIELTRERVDRLMRGL